MERLKVHIFQIHIPRHRARSMAAMIPTPFDWPRLITEITDESFGIPPDITFQIVENGQLHEVKAHKMILALVSHTFKTMFYATDVGDKTAKITKIDQTNAPTFQIVIDAVYSIKSIEASLKGKSVDEVFDVVKLLERYQIAGLMGAVKDQLANYPLTDDTHLEVAKILLSTCMKFINPKLEDKNSMMRYAAENEERKEVFATLLATMNDIVNSTRKSVVSAEPFDWPRLITKMTNESFGIPPDVTFQIKENGELHEVKAHKMILGMVSPTFRTMFYTTDVGDKNANVIKIKKTTAPAFRIMINAVYNVKSIDASLEGKSVHEIFDVMILVLMYQIAELIEAVMEQLAKYLITDETVLEVAEDAMEYTRMFQAAAQKILVACAKLLEPKLNDRYAVLRYVAEHEDRGEVVGTLLARMYDLVPCPNCNKEVCQDGETVKNEEFRVGLLVSYNRDSGYGGNNDGVNLDCGTGRVTEVEATIVKVENIKPGVTQNGLIGSQFCGWCHKSYNNAPVLLFRCK